MMCKLIDSVVRKTIPIADCMSTESILEYDTSESFFCTSWSGVFFLVLCMLTVDDWLLLVPLIVNFMEPR